MSPHYSLQWKNLLSRLFPRLVPPLSLPGLVSGDVAKSGICLVLILGWEKLEWKHVETMDRMEALSIEFYVVGVLSGQEVQGATAAKVL